MLILALTSLALLWVEASNPSSPQLERSVDIIDVIIALIFLSDLLAGLYQSKNRRQYFALNWYLLLACIPITSAWAQALRGLRVVEVVRVFRAAAEIDHSTR